MSLPKPEKERLKYLESEFGKLGNNVKLITGVLDFIRQAYEADTPLITSWSIDVDGDMIHMVRFWASVGVNSPFDRIQHLLQQNELLIKTLGDLNDKIKFAESKGENYVIQTIDSNTIEAVLSSFFRKEAIPANL